MDGCLLDLRYAVCNPAYLKRRVLVLAFLCGVWEWKLYYLFWDAVNTLLEFGIVPYSAVQ